MYSDIRRKVTPRSIAAMEGLEEEPEKSELEEERTLREERKDATDLDAFQSVTINSEDLEVILRIPLPDIPFPDEGDGDSDGGGGRCVLVMSVSE